MHQVTCDNCGRPANDELGRLVVELVTGGPVKRGDACSPACAGVLARQLVDAAAAAALIPGGPRGCAACSELGPRLIAPGTSGRSWRCDGCGTTWAPGMAHGADPYPDEWAALTAGASEAPRLRPVAPPAYEVEDGRLASHLVSDGATGERFPGRSLEVVDDPVVVELVERRPPAAVNAGACPHVDAGECRRDECRWPSCVAGDGLASSKSARHGEWGNRDQAAGRTVAPR